MSIDRRDIPPELTRDYLLTRRQALLIELAAIERTLHLPRSVARHQERRAARRPTSEEDRHGHE